MFTWPYGSQQSPINIDSRTTIPTKFPSDYLDVKYPDEELCGHFHEDDHNFYFTHPPILRYNGGHAMLQRVHIHSRSEHHIDNNIYDFEIHFVHPLPDERCPDSVTADSNHLVLAAFFKEEKTATTPKSIKAMNRTLQEYSQNKTKATEQKDSKIPGHVNPCEFLPKDRTKFYRYEGSLTTPNICGYYKERVTWIVFPEVIEVAPNDVESLKKHAKEDARPIQLINRRVILRNAAK
jgi:carbonic anhydrase